MPGQFRGWFNALFWASVTITGKAPFKSLFGYESLKDEKGEEMHKSKGNAIWFDDAVEKIGADTMRLLYCLQDPSQEIRFGFNVAKEPKNNINIFYNLRQLIENQKNQKISAYEDKWIVSMLNSLIKYVTGEIENLHPHNATRALQNFWLNDFSRGYIQIVRDRISNDDEKVKAVMKDVYVTLLKLCAPIIPFVTEIIWQELRKRKIVEEESVHLSSWPKANAKKIDKKLENEFENLFKIIEIGLASRDNAKIGLRWPLLKAKIYSKKLDKSFEELIKQQLNVKSIEWVSGNKKELMVELDTASTPELEAEGYARELTRQVQSFRKKLGLQKKDVIELRIITDEDFKKILEMKKSFIKDRTNSKKVEIVGERTLNVDNLKEKFKNKISFSIRDKRGVMIIITNR